MPFPPPRPLSLCHQVSLVFDAAAREGKALFAGVGLFTLPSAACKCPASEYFEPYFAVDGVKTLDYAAATCVRCETGFACAAGSRKSCGPEGGFAFGGASECSVCGSVAGWGCDASGVAAPCLPGTYNAGGTSCLPCPVGSACPDGKATVCPKGKYAHASGMRCIDCKPGTFTALNASTACGPCAAGRSSNFMRDACTDCPLGQYGAGGEGAPCAECAAGTFANSTGRAACDSCPAGRYMEHAGAKFCATCPPGSTATTLGNDDVGDCA